MVRSDEGGVGLPLDLLDDVNVTVDQAGHQRALAAVHDLRLRRLDRPVRQFLDAIALDQQFVAVDKLVRDMRIEQAEVAEKSLGHGDLA